MFINNVIPTTTGQLIKISFFYKNKLYKIWKIKTIATTNGLFEISVSVCHSV